MSGWTIHDDFATPIVSDEAKEMEEFNEAMLHDVINSNRWRKHTIAIQDIVTKLETLPGLCNEAYKLTQRSTQENILTEMLENVQKKCGLVAGEIIALHSRLVADRRNKDVV